MMTRNPALGGVGAAVTGILASLLLPATASAEVGRGFLQIADVVGNAKEVQFKNWIRVEGRYWGLSSQAPQKGTGAAIARGVFSMPTAPLEGGGELIVAVDKRSSALPAMMARCHGKAPIADLQFAESADDFRSTALELGARPATVPEFFRYKLKGVSFGGCPIVAGAPEQAFVLKFTAIEWLNYDMHNPRVAEGVRFGRSQPRKVENVVLTPASLPAARQSGQVKTFVLNWLGYARGVGERDCPLMNKKPLPKDFGMEDIDPTEARGGATNPLENRGAQGLNVCLLPGIAPDPGNAGPQATAARGLNLDGHDGTGPVPAITCPHKNYVSETGEKGIDNQFYAVTGCTAGLQGGKGLWHQVLNEEWRSGAVSLLIQVSGIDDERNDDDVDVTLLYSEDDPVKDPGGKEVLSDYTFRVSDKPELTHFFRRLRGKIVNGVIETEKVASLELNMVKGPALRLADAKLRLELTAEGGLKGVMGGYENWRYLANYYNYSGFEITFGFQCPSIYNALRRSADGMKDPETGEFNGISIAYDIEAFPAFIPESQSKAVLLSQQTR